jgi:hypothetical protein
MQNEFMGSQRGHWSHPVTPVVTAWKQVRRSDKHIAVGPQMPLGPVSNDLWAGAIDGCDLGVNRMRPIGSSRPAPAAGGTPAPVD